jgi:hemolysin type calcium-binding protein
MTTTIPRAGVAVALALLMATCLAGLARAANVIQCAPSPEEYAVCEGTDRNDVMYGTNQNDLLYAYEGVDTVYGRDGNDSLTGGFGPDTVYGGPGDDKIDDGESDYWSGEDENYGGPGNDYIWGNLMSEKHFGGQGDDSLADYKSSKRPDTFRCGPGYDRVVYNKGLDKVTDDCEELIAAGPESVTPH